MSDRYRVGLDQRNQRRYTDRMRNAASLLVGLVITAISITQSKAPIGPVPVEWLERPVQPWGIQLPKGGLCLVGGVPCEKLMRLPPKVCPAEGDACDLGDVRLVPV